MLRAMRVSADGRGKLNTNVDHQKQKVASILGIVLTLTGLDNLSFVTFLALTLPSL